MAAAAVELDESVLAQQAAVLDRRAEQLRAQARDLNQQAIELRLEIERQKREPIRILRPRVGVERDARLLAKVAELLEQLGPCKSTVLAEHLNVTQQRTYQALLVLEKSGVVKRSGVRRGTIWGLAEDEDLTGHAPISSARTLVLAAGQKLGTFTVDDLDVELQMLTHEAIRRACKALADDGSFTVERIGNRKVYAWEKPSGPHVPRPRHEAPEAKIVKLARRHGAPIAGTGRTAKPTDKDVRELFEKITEAGGELKRLDNGHWQVRLRDQVVEVLPGSPSDWRALANARARLRRAGLGI